MATDSVLGLFQDPSQLQQAQRQQFMENSMGVARLDPSQLASFYAMQGGYGLGNVIGSALGAEDPVLQKQTQLQSILKDYDPNTLEGLQGAANELRQQGMLKEAYALAQKAQEYQVKIEDKQAARDTQLQIAREKIMGQIEAAKERGATQLQIAQMQIEGRKELAAIAAALKQGQQQEKPLGINDLKMIDAAQGQFEGAQQVNNEAAKYIKLIDDGKMNFGFTENLGTSYRTMTNSANESDLNKTNFEQFIQNSVNNVLNQAKGTQAKDDAIRAEKQIMSALSRNDNKAVKASLQELQRVMGNVAKDAEGTLRLVGQERKRDLTPQKGNTGGSNKTVKWGDL